MTHTSLPTPFEGLEPWVADWSIPHEAGRFNKRVSSSMRDLDRFVAAVFPRIEEIVDFLNRIPTSDPDALEAPERRLFDLALMCMEATIPADLGWEVNDIEDAWPPERLTFLEPGWFPEPANRKEA
ncbi:MAG: hypothetical protein ACKVQQ_20685 [Burkholderiales bacterium]